MSWSQSRSCQLSFSSHCVEETRTFILGWVLLLGALQTHVAKQAGIQKKYGENLSQVTQASVTPSNHSPSNSFLWQIWDPWSLLLCLWLLWAPLQVAGSPMDQTPSLHSWNSDSVSLGQGQTDWFLCCPDTLFSRTPLPYTRLCRNFRFNEVL